MNLEFSGQIFTKHSDIRFRENPSSGSGVAARGRTDEGERERQTQRN